MIVTVNLILLILGLICFILSAIGVVSRVNLQSCGLALWILAVILGGFPR